MPSCAHRLSDTHKCKQPCRPTGHHQVDMNAQQMDVCMHTVLDSAQGGGGGGESWTVRKDARSAFTWPGSALRG
eukprot:4412294-Alexandrium_andersonii.AAC.1